MDNEEVFNSIINSQRQFCSLQLDTTRVTTLQQLYRLNAICFKFGLSIAELLWDSSKLTKAQIVTLLNFMPNLESLSAISWRLPKQLFEEPTPLLNLQHLHKLKVTKGSSFNPTDELTSDFFSNFLPHKAIKDLNLQAEPGSFLVCQKSVKKLELHLDSVNPDDLCNMQLTELNLKLRTYTDTRGRFAIESIIEKQPNLIALDISNCEGCFDEDDASFIAVCKLTKLESLKINIDDLSSSVFVENFAKLKSLKELQIDSYEHNFSPVVAIIDELSHLEMSRLEKLKIHLSDIGVPLDRIMRMGKNFVSLKNFTIRCDRPLSLDCYLENMNQLESLSIDYHYSREFSKLCNSFDVKCQSLRHLTLQGFAFGSDDVNENEVTLLKITEMVPNLEQLELDTALPFHIEFIFRIIEKLKRLKAIRNWSMVQSGEYYKQFDHQSVLNLKRIAGMLDQFSIELRLKATAIDIDVSSVRDNLCKEYNVAMTRHGSFILLKLNKK